MISYFVQKAGQALVVCLSSDVKPASSADWVLIETDTGLVYYPDGFGGWTGAASSYVTSPKRVIGMCFDGGGSPPTAGSIGYVVCPFNGTIDQWAIVADASGSAVVDVWKASGTIPTNVDTIAGTEKPTLSAQQLNSDTALSTWTTAVAAGDVFGFELESVATCTRVTCEVRISESV